LFNETMIISTEPREGTLKMIYNNETKPLTYGHHHESQFDYMYMNKTIILVVEEVYMNIVISKNNVRFGTLSIYTAEGICFQPEMNF
jgi:hypothetical protein